MATAKQITPINPDQEKAILQYASTAHQLLMNQYSMRNNLEVLDRYYMRENDWTEANIRNRIASRIGDKRKMQDVTVPIVMPQVRAALAYMANVFVTGYPIFGVSGDPQNEDAALQIETIMGENAVTAAWARELIMFFNDGLKYNLHAIELEWQQQTNWTIETDVSTQFANSAKPKKVLWKGNALKRMDFYNFFFDPRVHPAEVYKYGEYAGYIDMYSRVRMKSFINDLYGQVPVDTVKRAFESSPAAGGATGSGSPYSYYTPLINPYPVMNKNNALMFDWMSWAGVSGQTKTGIKYNNVYEVTKLYGRIIPADFGFRVPQENTPQVWKFIIVNGQVVLFAEQQSNVHNHIPIYIGQPLEDGLDFQTKSFADNVTDMQDVASAMLNGYIASKRRLVGDRVLYDPLRISAKEINSTSPAAKIPVRNSAFGKPVAESVYQFPYRDEATQTLLDGATRMVGFANQINAQNPAQQGQFVKGNKTKTEYEDTMGHGNSGNQLMAIMTEAQVFTPLKADLLLNVLQFQEATTYYNRDKQATVKVDPTTLRQTAVHFKVSDGLIPEEKQMDTDEWQTAMQVLGSNPQIGGGFDASAVFTYLMKLRGADLTPFVKDTSGQQIQQQVMQALGIVSQAIDKGNPPPTPEELKSWGNFTVWLGQTQQQLTQMAEQAMQKQAQAAQQNQQAPQPSGQATALASTQG